MTRSRTLIPCLAGLLALITGCAVEPEGFESPATVPERFDVTPASPDDADSPLLDDRWWLAFGDDRLGELQDDALSGNFDLAAARQRVMQARAVVRRDRSSLFPSLDYRVFGSERRRESADFEAENQIGASLDASYEADIWGRNRRLVDGARFGRLVTEEELRAAAITLTADVARTYYALVEQRGQSELLLDQIETNEKVLEAVRTRFAGGVVRASDVLRQERLLESTRTQLAAVRGSIDVLEHALLVLTGRPPMGGAGVELETLPTVPPRPAIGVPAELVTRRPDLRAGLFAIESADATVAASIADRYPSVTLTAEVGTVEETLGDLFSDWFSVLRIDVAGPLFDAGRRSAEVERARGRKDELILVYAQSVLEAFRQVEDALADEDALDDQIRLVERQLVLARRTSERLNREYLNGDISYIDVLDALSTEQQLQRDLLSLRRDRIEARIDLSVALAGAVPGTVPGEDDDPAVARAEDSAASTGDARTSGS